MSRPEWNTYFMGFAQAAKIRGTCDRKQVGAVIVVNRSVVATGYNGSIVGAPHCDQIGHDIVNDRCVRTVHAEMNAVAQAARHGHAIEGATLYATAGPCWDCFRVGANAGIKKFVFAERFSTTDPTLAAEMEKRISDAAYDAEIGLHLLNPDGFLSDPFCGEYRDSNKLLRLRGELISKGANPADLHAFIGSICTKCRAPLVVADPYGTTCGETRS